MQVCRECNSHFSQDEEHPIALLGSILSGSTDTGPVSYPNATEILARSLRLKHNINQYRKVQTDDAGRPTIVWDSKINGVVKVMVKNARGHVVYEIGEVMERQPVQVTAIPIQGMTPEQFYEFESIPGSFPGWPEVGSRKMQRLVCTQNAADPHEAGFGSWQVVQDGI